MRILGIMFQQPNLRDLDLGDVQDALTRATLLPGGYPWAWCIPVATIRTTATTAGGRDRLESVMQMRISVRLREHSLHKSPFAYIRAPVYRGGGVKCALAVSRHPWKVLHGLLNDKLNEELGYSNFALLPVPTEPIPLHLPFGSLDEAQKFVTLHRRDRPIPVALQEMHMDRIPLEVVLTAFSQPVAT